jgi:hypothetical protein
MAQSEMGAADTRLRSRRGLRLDKVAVGLIARMQRALADDVPDGMSLLFTVTTPIRVCVVNGWLKREPNVRGFVHNPDVDVNALFDEAQGIIGKMDLNPH